MPPVTKLTPWCALLVLAVLPVLSGVALHLRSGWYPESDDATIVLLAGDTFSTDPPLVGMISTAGAELDDPELHHPGPIELYMLAPLTAFGPGPATGSVLTAAGIAVASVATLVWAMYLVGGRRLAVLGLLGAAFTLWGMGADAPVSVWNPHVVVLPFAAFLACAAAVGVGRHRALVGAVATGSLVAQTHLSYVGLVGSLSVALATLTVWRMVWDRPPSLRAHRWAVVVGVVLWLPPVWDQVQGDPGNLAQIGRALAGPGGRAVGAPGVAELGRVVGVPLLGLKPNGDLIRVLPDATAAALALLVLPWAALVAVALLARSHRADLLPLVAMLAVGLAAAMVTAGRMPLADGVLYQYYGLWMWPLAAIFWVLVVWAAWQVLPAPARRRLGPTVQFLQRATTPPTGPAILAGLLVAVALLPRPGAWDPWAAQRRIAGDLAGPVGSVPTGGEVVVRFRGPTPYLSTGSAVVLAADHAGARVLVDAGAPTPVFPWREQRRYDGRSGLHELWVQSGDQAAPEGGTLVAGTETLTSAERAGLALRRTEAESVVESNGVVAGPRPPGSSERTAQVETVTADPSSALEALADGTLADLASRGLVTVRGLSADDLYELQRLSVLASEGSVKVYLVRP